MTPMAAAKFSVHTGTRAPFSLERYEAIRFEGCSVLTRRDSGGRARIYVFEEIWRAPAVEDDAHEASQAAQGLIAASLT